MAQKKTSNEEPGTFKIILGFFKTRKFWINVLIAIALILITYPLVNWMLSSYSNHDEEFSTPDLVNLKTEEVEAVVADKGLRYHILDSVYNRDGEKGIVLFQDPHPGDMVKANRTIYITVSRKMPEMVKMFDLVDKTTLMATGLLESRGLKVKEIQLRPHDLCDGCVLEQLYKGKPVAPEAPVPYGAEITLVVGQKEGLNKVSVPDLKGLTIEEATQRLNERTLNLGEVICPDCLTTGDSVIATVYKQVPKPSKYTMVPMGSGVDLYASPTPPEAPSDSITNTP